MNAATKFMSRLPKTDQEAANVGRCCNLISA